jgi:uncharacterized membrane protein YeaQ/YmgE (transglycosylase-associated protein family)
MTAVPLLILTFLHHFFLTALKLDSYSVIMNVAAWALFGAINGMVLYWIKPDKHVSGYLGAVVLGSSGALLGGAVAAMIYESLQNMNLALFVLLLMIVSSLFLLISQMVFQKQQLS